MDAKITTELTETYKIDTPASIEMLHFMEQFLREVKMKGTNIELKILNKQIKTKIASLLTEAGVAEVILIGEGMTSKIYTFTNGDLTNNSISKPNPFYTTILDVTLLNHLGEEIEVGTQVTATQITINLNRVTIPPNQFWSILIEK